MLTKLASAALPLLRCLDAERAQSVALAALRVGLGGRGPEPHPLVATDCLGLRFTSPFGLAAGFDKDATAVRGLLAAGFGFVEVGTVTPRPQPGNPRPRMFRLEQDAAVINRMGFNSAGAEAMAGRLAALGPRYDPVGVNLGINRQDAVPVRDYAALVERFSGLADYLVINVSSPNTPGLRDLQGEDLLGAILDALPRRRPPLLVKLAPDLADAALAPIIEVVVAHGLDGLVIANTTLARPGGLHSPLAREAGGLSGAPLFDRATAMLARVHLIAAGRLTLIGVGGIASGRQALTKIKAGASLVQLYTAFAYAGPALLARMQAELAAALRAEGFHCVRDAVGTEAERLAA